MNLSFSEIAVILVVALIVIGPKKLPEVAKSVGKGYAEFKRTFSDFKKSVDITDVTSTAKKADSAPTNSYKSRWEEQVSTPNAEEQEATVAEAPQTTTTATDEPIARAKRGDLVKEDENVTNG